MVVIKQSGGLGINAKDHVAAITAIAAVGSAEGLELLALNRDTAVAACSAGYVKYYPVYEGRHVFLLYVEITA
ncbi:hypothetical protein GCM10017710_16750 [Arthrobacter ramosus]